MYLFIRFDQLEKAQTRLYIWVTKLFILKPNSYRREIHMKHFEKHFKLNAGAALTLSAWAALVVPQPAYAQAAAATVQADKAAVELQTVTVTARRREENAQDVPAPVTAVSGKQLEQQRIDKVQDLQQTLPNVNAAFIHARQSSIAVRGIGNNPANEGLEASVGLYLDNVYLGRPGMAVFDLLDIEQVDLLRGPQGTLFGKNTTAGVLNISTRQPQFIDERSAEVSVGQHGYRQLKTVLNKPVNDTTAVRLSVYKSHLDGFVKNLADGDDKSGYDRTGLRGQVLYKPDAKFSLRLIGEYNKEDSDNAYILYSYGPTNAAGSTVLDRFSGIATGLKINPAVYEVNINAPQNFQIRQGGLSAEANWELANGHKLTSITAARKWNFNPHNDLDFTNADGFRDGGFNVKDWQFSQEVRLASAKSTSLDYVVGAYAFRQDINNENFGEYGQYTADALGRPIALRPVFNNLKTVSYGNTRTDSLAVFGQGTLHLDTTTDVTAGLRLTQEEKEGNVRRDPWTDTVSSAPVLAAVTDTRNLPALFGAWDSGKLQRKDNSIAGNVTVSKKLAPEFLGYVGLSTGSKSGGFNINGVGSGPLTGAESLQVEPEKAQNLEIGFKSQWLNRRLTFNANAYLTRVTGYQTNSYVLDPGGLPRAAIINAGSVKAKGVEFDLAARPTRTLTVAVNGSYNDARYVSFTRAPAALENNFGTGNGGFADLSGQPLNGAPRWTLNTNVRQTFRISDTRAAYVGGSYGWRSGSYGDLSNSKYSWIPAYGLLNLAAGYQVTVGDTRWDLSLWARNVTDKRYYLAVNNNPSLAGTYYGAPGQSRTVGVTLKADF